MYKIYGTLTVAQINEMSSDAFTAGDVVNVSDSGTITLGEEPVVVNVGDNIVWVGSGFSGHFDKLAGLVDLSSYVTQSALNTTLSSYLLTSTFNSTIANYVTSSSLATTLESYVTSDSLTTTLGSYATKSYVTSALSPYVTRLEFEDTLNYYVTTESLQDSVYNKSEVDSLLGAKQNTLVSGTNIKTVNGSSLLGSGNISIPVITVDSALSSSSTNPVKNSVIYSALAGKQNSLTFDATPTANSNNPVYSKGIKSYVDNAVASALSNVYKYVGSFTVAEINAMDASSFTPGDVVNVEDSGTVSLGSEPVSVNAGDNLAWVGEGFNAHFDKLAGLVDLSSYVTNTSLASTLSSYVTNTSLSSTLASYVTSSSLNTTLGSYVTTSSLNTTLGSYATTSYVSTNYVTQTSLNTTLSDYVTNGALSEYYYNKQYIEDNYMTAYNIINGYQPLLSSGTNIKTVNGNSLLGSGNITISGGVSAFGDLTGRPSFNGSAMTSSTSIYGVSAHGTSGQIMRSNGTSAPSWTYIKTVNGNSLLGSGNITISGGSTTFYTHSTYIQWNGGDVYVTFTSKSSADVTGATSLGSVDMVGFIGGDNGNGTAVTLSADGHTLCVGGTQQIYQYEVMSDSVY